MVRRTKEEAHETRDQILNAATQVFCDKSYANATLEDIAEEANVTRGAIYWHFKNKADIFEALHEQLQCPLLEMMSKYMIETHPRPLEALQESCTNLLINLEQDAHKRRLLTLFMQHRDYSGDLSCYKLMHNEKQAEHLAAFTKYFQNAKPKNNLVSNFDPEIAAQSLSCYIKGIITEYLNDPENHKMSTRAPALMDVFFKGLMAE